jgi:LPXTG-site transpeptidase (sortase) family protein
MSTPSTQVRIESEISPTSGLVVALLSFATMFSSVYAPLVFFVSSERLDIALSDDGGSSRGNGGSSSGGLVESEKPVKKEAENLPPIPDRLVASSIGLDTTIVNPRSRDYTVLDNALLEGAVYYPGSGYLGDTSNLLLFGHSSFLPIVRNQNYRVFNNIKNLQVGDEIEVYSRGEKFVYVVTSTTLAREDEIRVNFGAETPMITLATCNSFGAKEDRYVVEAKLSRSSE